MTFVHSQVEEYLGIPYAEPPVGGNRFKDPKPITKPYVGVSTFIVVLFRMDMGNGSAHPLHFSLLFELFKYFNNCLTSAKAECGNSFLNLLDLAELIVLKNSNVLKSVVRPDVSTFVYIVLNLCESRFTEQMF